MRGSLCTIRAASTWMRAVLISMVSVGIFLASCAPRVPPSGTTRNADRNTYAAPVQSSAGADYGKSTMVYWMESSPTGAFSHGPVTRICWSCSLVNGSSVSWGGELVFSIEDGVDTDRVLGRKRIDVQPGGTASVSDTASFESADVTHLGIPHWRLLCRDSDPQIRCGRVRRVSG